MGLAVVGLAAVVLAAVRLTLGVLSEWVKLLEQKQVTSYED